MIDLVGCASFILQLFERIIPFFGKDKFIVDNVIIQLDVPRKGDGAGGYIHGSHGSFTLEIINKKGHNIVIENLYCVAFCGKTVLQNRIICYNQLAHEKIAEKLIYDPVKVITVPARESKTIKMRFTSNENLKECDRIMLFCSSGIRKRKITVYAQKEKYDA